MPEHGVWCELIADEIRFGRNREISKVDRVPWERQLVLKSKLNSICASFELPFEELDQDGSAASLSHPGGQESPPKHVLQEESIIGHMRRSGVLKSPKTLLNLGCGRACLSERLQTSSSISHHHVLVDRNPMKRARCRDVAMRKHGHVDRIIADLRDLDLHELSLDAPVAFSKHLCGPATDYALRCLDSLDRSQPPGSSTPCFLAPCCHHSATWEAYTNPEWLANFGFDETDFNHICALSHWASLAAEDEAHGTADENAIKSSFTRQEKILLGKQCKLFLDMGRAQALKKRYTHATLVQYTTLSVESRLIVAYD